MGGQMWGILKSGVIPNWESPISKFIANKDVLNSENLRILNIKILMFNLVKIL